ncbi:hypothetical protein QWY77_11755 [Thalassotalea ponticola]|uniref:hypothetical protein n=1 Tax=Thalassotalea ponticola TaxID=1523392 RepID=UPI0025B404CF|nr:hypothetical protein [Thalassotalea ponticola]MDN3653417.1 hypothetical protein [Thalassotalea ponticola]
MPRIQSIVFGLACLFIFIFVAHKALFDTTSDSGLFTILLVILGIPLGLIGWRLLFASTRERNYGYFSPLTLCVLGVLIVIVGLMLAYQGARGSGIAVAGGLALIALGKRRRVQRRKQKLWFK